MCEFGQQYSVVAYRVLCDIQDGVLTVAVLQIGNRRPGDSGIGCKRTAEHLSPHLVRP